MFQRLPISVLGLSLACFGLVACGGGGSDEGGNEEVDTTTGDSTGESTSESGTDTGTTDPTTDTGTTDPTTEETTDPTTEETTDPTTDTGTGTETTGGACQVWQITYDLSDSEFEISGTPLGAGDQVNVVVEDDQADDEIGPGTMVLYFEDMGGNPGGMAWIASYDMDSNFVVSSAGATVTTDLVISGEPAGCALAEGTLENGEVAWSNDEMADTHTMGTILCMGNFCMLGGLPNGMAVPVDEVGPQAISPFQFENDLSAFTMDQTVIQMDANSTTSWMYVGTETGRELIDAPACACAP
jgi:hypothetical protein